MTNIFNFLSKVEWRSTTEIANDMDSTLSAVNKQLLRMEGTFVESKRGYKRTRLWREK